MQTVGECGISQDLQRGHLSLAEIKVVVVVVVNKLRFTELRKFKIEKAQIMWVAGTILFLLLLSLLLIIGKCENACESKL